MVTVSEIFRESVRILRECGIESAEFDAKCIAEDVLGMRFSRIISEYHKFITDSDEKKMRLMIKKRSEGYPLQYILGEWEFYGLPFKVGEGVLIPRPDTETLVDTVLELCNGKKGLEIIDLCSGSGCIAVAIEKNTVDSEVYAVEISDCAFRYLEENIKLNDSNVKSVKADVLLSETTELFSNTDVIVSNPPYLTADDMKNLQKEVSFEPETALCGKSPDGLEFYRKISEIWGCSLKKGGIMAFEVGAGQAKDVEEIMLENRFSDIKTVCDLCGNERVVYGIRAGKI